MLPKKRRLDTKTFKKVFFNGVKKYSKNISVIYRQNNKNISKFAFVVPKNFYTNVPEKNKLKRQGFSIVKDKLSEIKEGFDVIFIFSKKKKKENALPDFKSLSKEISDLLHISKINEKNR